MALSTYNKISIIGSGVVGTATGKGFQKIGHDVYFYDISQRRLDTLESEGYRTTRNIVEALSKSQISFICVNTPTIEEKMNSIARQDLSQLTSALYDLASGLNYIHRKRSFQSNHRSSGQKRQASFQYPTKWNKSRVTGVSNTSSLPRLLVFRSTMLPGTMRSVVLRYLETHSSLRIGRDYNVVYNPEFIRQNHALHDFLKVDRVVIGEDNITLPANSSALLQALYKPLTDKIIVTNYEAAELIKYAANCFLALKISYFNEIGIICRKLGIDDNVVNHAVSLDHRIGSYGTQAGSPFGGSCLPKDTKAFAALVREKGILPLDLQSDLLHPTLEINKLLMHDIDHRYQKRKAFRISTTANISDKHHKDVAVERLLDKCNDEN
jgi:UDPglucose 6-dehydrogenase